MPAAALRRIVAAALIAGGAAGAPVASAHTALTATDPGPDSTVSPAPTRVSATFNEELQQTFAAMTVVGPDGKLWSFGEPEVRGATVRIEVRAMGPAGVYTANYRVASADGHVVSGSWSFTVTTTGTGQSGPAIGGSGPDTRIPLGPLAVGAAVLIAAATLWRVRRRRT